MTGGGLDGDKIVALIGLVMTLALVSNSSLLQRLPWNKRILYGAIWVGLFGVATFVATWFIP